MKPSSIFNSRNSKATHLPDDQQPAMLLPHAPALKVVALLNLRPTGQLKSRLEDGPLPVPGRRSIVSVQRGIFVALAITGLLIGNRKDAQAAAFAVNTQAQWVGGVPGVYNPRSPHGLMAVASQSADYSAHYPPYYLQATADAAAYGSDSWRDAMGIPVSLLDLAVEPMADAQAHAFSASPSENSGGASGFAGATIQVHHRVAARSFPPELQDTLERLSVIRIKFRFKLHVSVKGPAGQNLESSAYAYVHLYSPDQPVFSWMTNLSVDTKSGPLTAETSVTNTINLRRHRTNEVHTYWLTAEASAHARSFKGVGAEALAVADPLLQVDPDWEYAPYFVVVQESIQHPGQWLEITREWENILLRPTLTMTQTNSTMTLSWPANAGEFALQAATNLDSPVVWYAETNQPVLSANSQWEVTLPETMARQRFYRLVSP